MRSTTTPPRLFAAMCTHQRPNDAVRSLVALLGQEVRPELVVVVDNGSDRTTRDRVVSLPLPVLYVDPGANLGPAGGFARALEELVEADDEDLVLFLDDDDPLPQDPRLVARLVGRLTEGPADACHPIAGVGVRGGVLDRRIGVVRSRPGPDTGLVDADHLHGGAFPLYRVGPLRRTAAFDPALFWGFEELAAGRRLVGAGYRLQVDAGLTPLVADRDKYTGRGPRSGLADPSWRHYYRHRNLLRVLRRERAWSAVAATVVLRLVAKPLVHFPFRPRRALWHLRTNLAAVVDGLGPERRMLADAARRPS